MNRQETLLCKLLEAAADLDHNQISRMAEAVGWTWGSCLGDVPEAFEVKDQAVKMAKRLYADLAHLDNYTVASSWSCGFSYMITENVEEHWMRVQFTWGPLGGEDDGTDYDF